MSSKNTELSRSEEFHFGDSLMQGYSLSWMGYHMGDGTPGRGMGYQIGALVPLKAHSNGKLVKSS